MYGRMFFFKRMVTPIETIPTVANSVDVVYDIVGGTVASILMTPKTLGKTTWISPPANDPTVYSEP